MNCWASGLVSHDLAGALADRNEALRLLPNNPNFLNSRGLVQLKLGALDRAIADYGSAVAQNPKDAGSLYGRGVAKLKSGNTADITAAKAIKPDIAEVYFRLWSEVAGALRPIIASMANSYCGSWRPTTDEDEHYVYAIAL